MQRIASVASDGSGAEMSSDVLALAWPESQGFGPAWSGFGPEI
jgi:hypothetical protein